MGSYKRYKFPLNIRNKCENQWNRLQRMTIKRKKPIHPINILLKSKGGRKNNRNKHNYRRNHKQKNQISDRGMKRRSIVQTK